MDYPTFPSLLFADRYQEVGATELILQVLYFNDKALFYL